MMDKYEVRCSSNYYQYKYPTKKGAVTVPPPKKDFPIRTVKSILNKHGLILINLISFLKLFY